MSAGTILPKKGIDVILGGEKKTLRFTMGSLAWLADRHGNINKALEIFSVMASGEIGAKELHALADLICAALQYSDKEITPEQIEETLDMADIISVMPDIVEAFMIAMGQKKNEPEKKERKANPRKV